MTARWCRPGVTGHVFPEDAPPGTSCACGTYQRGHGERSMHFGKGGRDRNEACRCGHVYGEHYVVPPQACSTCGPGACRAFTAAEAS